MKIFAKLTAVLALLAACAFAAEPVATKLTLDLTQEATFAGTRLAPGSYHVYVTRNGDNAQIQIKQYSKQIVTTTATFKPMSSFAAGVALAQTQSHEVLELQSRKLGGAFVLNSAPSTDAPSQGSSK